VSFSKEGKMMDLSIRKTNQQLKIKKKSVGRHSIYWKKGPHFVTHGDGKLDSFTPLMSTVLLGDAVLTQEVRSSFCVQYYCLLAVKRVPIGDFGSGDHFLLIEPRIKFPNQSLSGIAKAGAVLTPTALLGNVNCCDASMVGNSVFSRLSKKNSTKKGTVIGVARIDKETGKYFIDFNTDNLPIRIIPPMIFKEQMRVDEKFTSSYAESKPMAESL
jgi:hypothetical protein